MSFSNRTAALFRDEAQSLTLLACVGASIALHSLALFALPEPRAAARSDTAVVLSAFFSPRPVAPAPPVEKLAPKPQELSREVRPEDPSPVLARPLPAPVLPQFAGTLPAPEPDPRSEVHAAQPTVLPRTPETGAHPAAVGERPPVDGLDAGLLEKYRLALIDAAGRYRRYPVQAMDRGWQGRVEIRLVIDANGAIKNAIIKTSSRYPVLDRQALEMVKKGKLFARIPPALNGREFTVDIPVIFELQTG